MDNGALLVIEEQELVKKTVKFIRTGENACEKCYFHDHGHCPWDCDDGYYVEHNPSHWHTGTPTENGYYLVCLIYCGNTYYLGMHFNDGVWNDSEYEYGFDWLKVDMLAWMPLEPYKEKEK